MSRRLVAAAVLSALFAGGCHHAAIKHQLPTTVGSAPPMNAGPLDVAGIFAAAVYTARPRLDLATAHLQRVLPRTAGVPPDRRPVGVEVLGRQLVDPRQALVVVEVDVQRTWLDQPAPSVDPTPHVVRLTMVVEPPGRWLVDDLEVVA